MKKSNLLFLLLGIMTTPLSGQYMNISTRFFDASKTIKNAGFFETTELIGAYKDIDFTDARNPKLKKADTKQQYLYKNGHLVQVLIFAKSTKEQVIGQFDFEYEGDQVKQIKSSLLNLNKDYQYVLMPYQTTQATFKNGRLLAETVRNADNALLEEYQYEPVTEHNGFPLIRYKHTRFEQEGAVVKTDNLLQYNNEGMAFYYSISGADTVFSITRKWASPNAYEETVIQNKVKTQHSAQVYRDALGNETMIISSEKGNPKNKTVWYREIKYNIETTTNSELKNPVVDDQPAPVVPIDIDTIEELPVSELPAPELDDKEFYHPYEIEQQPFFQNDDADGLKFLQTNIQYPEVAKKKHLTGNVVVAFVIETDGSLSNLEIKRDIGSGCGAEVLRVLRLMPAWIPGRLQGTAVRVKVVRPVSFRLE